MRTLMQEVAVNNLQVLFTSRFFDICTLKKLLSMLGGELTEEEDKLLGYVHCMHYSKMSDVARTELALYLRNILARYIPEASLPEVTQLLLTK